MTQTVTNAMTHTVTHTTTRRTERGKVGHKERERYTHQDVKHTHIHTHATRMGALPGWVDGNYARRQQTDRHK
jgi:hypothetical protein